MKATTLTTRTFEMMYYETRGVYCNPAEKFLSYTEFKKIFEPALFSGCNINELATTIYNKAISNGATEEAALHAALFVFSFTAGKQAARKWFDELVAAEQPENNSSDDNSESTEQPENNSSDDNSESTEQPENNSSDNDNDHNDNSESTEQPENNSSDDNSKAEKDFKTFGRDLGTYLNTYTMFDATKDGAFVPIINKYRINCIEHIKRIKQHYSDEEIVKLADATINALKDAENGAVALFNLYICFDESGFNVMNKEHCTKALEFLKDYLPKPKPEEDPKDPDPKDPSDSGVVIEPLEEIFEPIEVANVRSEIRSPLEAISNGDTPNKKSIPDVKEACLFNGKEFSDNDLVTILKNKITVLEGRKVSRNSINMLLNLIMNNQDKFVTKLIDLGAKAPLEIKEVKVTKYTTDKNRFDTVFEVATDTEPIVFFYHWDPILNEEGTAWTYDALVLPFDKVTLTKDAKKAKADSKRQKKTKKQTTEQPAPQPQAMTATA